MTTTPITLQQLSYFLSAIEHGSLSAAAEANFIAQPSLSEQIRRLENHLGVALFIRTNRKLIVTDAARMLIPHAQRTLVSAEEAAAAVNPIRTLTGGTIGFGTFSSAHHLIHADLVANFHALHPGVHLRLVGGNSVSIADAVRDGEIEAALVALPVDDRGLEVGPVEWATEAVYLSRDPDRTRNPLPIDEVARAELILPETRWGDMDPTRRELVALAQNAGVTVHPIVEVESPAVALELTARGVGDTIISLALADILGATKTLHWTSLNPRLYETFAFITRRYANLPPAASVLIRLARELLAKLPMI
jgi:LysR family cyn operon transcriptional activator